MSSFVWDWRKAITKSALKSTTKLVLFALSFHMNAAGYRAFPSTKTLARECSLTERSVCTHLELARIAGWLRCEARGRGYQYFALVPGVVTPDSNTATRPNSPDRGGDGDGSLNQNVGLKDDHSDRALNEVQSILPGDTSMEAEVAFVRRGASAGIFETLWNTFPRNPNSQRDTAEAAFEKLPVDRRIDCVRGAANYAVNFREHRQDLRSRDEALRFVPSLANWIRKGNWEAYP